MAKRAKHIWPEIVNFTNLLEAWRLVQLGKRYRHSVVSFRANLEDNLLNIQEALCSRTWQPSPCRHFKIMEIKPRDIDAPTVGDCVVHHAVMNVMEKHFERRFIGDSYACRTGKGTHAASMKTTEFMRVASLQWGSPYVLKGDISKFFMSIPHNRLFSVLEHVVSDKDVLWLFDQIIFKNGYSGRGLPLGALTSQWLANLYLDKLDHFVKEDLGIHLYVRYMDDFVIVGQNKEWCNIILDYINDFVTMSLDLQLNRKTAIWPISHGIDFVGYRHWTGHKLPRKRTVKRAKNAFKLLPAKYSSGKIDIKYVRSRVASFVGYMNHCDGHNTLKHILENLVLIKNHI